MIRKGKAQAGRITAVSPGTISAPPVGAGYPNSGANTRRNPGIPGSMTEGLNGETSPVHEILGQHGPHRRRIEGIAAVQAVQQ